MKSIFIYPMHACMGKEKHSESGNMKWFHKASAKNNRWMNIKHHVLKHRFMNYFKGNFNSHSQTFLNLHFKFSFFESSNAKLPAHNSINKLSWKPFLIAHLIFVIERKVEAMNEIDEISESCTKGISHLTLARRSNNIKVSQTNSVELKSYQKGLVALKVAPSLSPVSCWITVNHHISSEHRFYDRICNNARPISILMPFGINFKQQISIAFFAFVPSIIFVIHTTDMKRDMQDLIYRIFILPAAIPLCAPAST